MAILCLITIIVITHNIVEVVASGDGPPGTRETTMRLSTLFALEAVAVMIGAVSAMVITGAVLRLF
jgi:hypothetical protein